LQLFQAFGIALALGGQLGIGTTALIDHLLPGAITLQVEVGLQSFPLRNDLAGGEIELNLQSRIGCRQATSHPKPADNGAKYARERKFEQVQTNQLRGIHARSSVMLWGEV
jgi:hypothetical protein